MALSDTRRTRDRDWSFDEKGPSGLSAYTAIVARQVLREEQNKGDMQDAVTIVDKRVGGVEESVKFGGKIVYIDRNQHIADIVEDIWKMLVNKSPIGDAANKRGKEPWRREHYHKVHQIFFNRKLVEVANIEQMLKQAKLGDEIAIVNLLPYAKRIEYGMGKHKTSDRKALLKKPRKSITAWSDQAPHGVYRQVYKVALRKYGARTFIKFRLVRAPEVGYSFRNFTKTGSSMVEQRYPAILIKVSKLTKTG